MAGLAFNATTHRQEATFNLIATITQTNGTSFPAGTTFSYSWSDPRGVLTFQNPNGNTTSNQIPMTALMTNPGLGFPTCTIVVTTGNGVTYAGTSSYRCAAIGGPITTQLVALSGDRAQLEKTYNHDLNDPKQPFYLTYYNYTHASAAPQYAEETQNATIATALGQPYVGTARYPGTTVTYGTLPNTYVTPGAQSIAPGAYIKYSENVFAESDFQNAVPTIHFHYADGVISGDADDDSATTQVPVKDPKTQAVTWMPLVYKISAHKPDHLVDCNDPSVLPPSGALNDPSQVPPGSEPPGVTGTTRPLDPSRHQGATYWTDIQVYRYTLIDTTGARMPGVFVQERFTDHDPLNLTVNGTAALYWPTLLKSVVDSGAIDPMDGMFGSNKVGGAQGVGLVYDGLYLVWGQGVAATSTTTHSYFAGTKDASYDSRTGVDLGAYLITFTPGAPNTAGTAGQTGPTTTPPPPGP